MPGPVSTQWPFLSTGSAFGTGEKKSLRVLMQREYKFLALNATFSNQRFVRAPLGLSGTTSTWVCVACSLVKKGWAHEAEIKRD